jgi:hypothetical protein
MDKATKTAAREWARRCRESLRDMEAALKADRLDDAEQYALQASGEAGEAQQVLVQMVEAA